MTLRRLLRFRLLPEKGQPGPISVPPRKLPRHLFILPSFRPLRSVELSLTFLRRIRGERLRISCGVIAV